MSVHLIDALFGMLGGAIPGGLHFAWKVSHNNRTVSGTFDLTLRRPPAPGKKPTK
jgi:hypothetical protein